MPFGEDFHRYVESFHLSSESFHRNNSKKSFHRNNEAINPFHSKA